MWVPNRKTQSALPLPRLRGPYRGVETRNPVNGAYQVESRWNREQGNRKVTVHDLARNPDEVAMSASIFDGLQGAIRQGENLMQPVDARQTLATYSPQSGVGRANAIDRVVMPAQTRALARGVYDGTAMVQMRVSRGNRGLPNFFNAGMFTLPEPDVIPSWYGQDTNQGLSSYKMRPAGQGPPLTATVRAAGLTGHGCQDSMRAQEKQRPSRMMQSGQRNLVPQTSAQDSHRAAQLRARVSSYNRPAGFQNVWPTGVSPRGVPGPADPTRANLRSLPNAIHTSPILATHNAAAAGVSMMAAARGDGRGADGRPLEPFTDSHGFTFGYRHRTDFRSPSYYPARDAMNDKLFLENANKFTPDYQADLMDRRAVAMVDRFPEPLESRDRMIQTLMRDFTCAKDRYMVPRRGASVTNPNMPAPHDKTIHG